MATISNLIDFDRESFPDHQTKYQIIMKSRSRVIAGAPLLRGQNDGPQSFNNNLILSELYFWRKLKSSAKCRIRVFKFNQLDILYKKLINLKKFV